MAIYFPDGNGGRKIIAQNDLSLADLKLTGFSGVADTTGELEDNDNLLTALAKLKNRRQVPEQLISIRTPHPNSTLTYNGETQSPVWDGYDENQMSILAGSQTEATNAGTYSVTFSLLEGYAWEDGTLDAKTVEWTIIRATVSSIPSQSNSLFYDGTPKAPAWRNYDSNQLTIGGTVQATDKGTYTVTFTPKTNYQWADGTTSAKIVSWAIGSSVLDAVPTVAAKLNYTGSAQSPTWNNFDAARLEIGGTTSAQNVGTYSATFTPKNGVVWSDGTTATKTVEWTIERASLAIPTVTTTTFTYNGNNQAPTIGSYDDAVILVTGNAPQINAGSYTLVCSLKDNANYQWSDGTIADISTPWTIRKVSVEIPAVTNTTFSQDGQPHTPTIGTYDANLITVTGNEAQSAIGTYEITFQLKDSTNYQWLDGSTEEQTFAWEIEFSYEQFYSNSNMLIYNTMRFATDVFIFENV